MLDFKRFKSDFQKHFTNLCKKNDKLFVTDTDKETIWNTYLDSFPDGTIEIFRERREHDCNCCKSFIRQYGNIVAIEKNKVITIWDIENLEFPFNVVAEKMSKYVKSKQVIDLFVTDIAKLGTDYNFDKDTTKKWDHFYFELPSSFVTRRSESLDTIKGQFRDSKNVFKRSMDELTLDAGKMILELINQGSLYRGDEFKKGINEFISYKTKYEKISESEKNNWCWVNSNNNPISRIRNTAIGTLLIDLSEGVELDDAVTKFERVVAPTNYKRPKAIFTKKMVEDAENKIKELGFENSLERRHATVDDITINNVLFVNRDIKKKLTGTSVFDSLKTDSPVNSKSLSKVEEVNIEDFVTKILPDVSSIEIMMESKHQSNLMSLIAPKDKKAPSMLKWSNNFSWAYTGDITDSMKQNVKNAGGKIDGVLRFSIQWNDDFTNHNDFDAHCVEPKGNHIYFGSKFNRITGGNLDVDIIYPEHKVAVENITWPDVNRMEEGEYTFYVNNYNHRGGRTGFSAEIEFNGQIFQFNYNRELRQSEEVFVAKVKYSKKNGFEMVKSLDSTMSSKEVWGIKTNVFTKVKMMMFSPNYWDGQVGIGNKHYFFILDNCKNETNPRGFFNEFLKEELTPHRKVFEALGSKMAVEMSDDQLSGLGFSSTKRNSVVAKIEGKFTRTIKLMF